MARPLRIEFDGAWYHVMNRGQGRKWIVRSDSDRKCFFDILAETVATYGIEVHAYSLMDNHYHLLIHTPKAGLSRAMRHLNSVYTQRMNRAWKTDGPLYRGRYKAKLVDEDDYLIELIRYIHRNPVDAKICTKAKDHKWTSHKFYLDKRRAPVWLKTQELLKRFGDGRKEAVKHLENFVNQGVPTWFSEALKKNRVVLGKEGFKDWVYLNHVNSKQKEVPLKEKNPKARIPIRKILKHVSLVYDVSISSIRQQHARKANEPRAVAIYLCRQLTGMKQRELADWFKSANEYTIAKTLERFKIRLNLDKRLKKLVREIEKGVWSYVKI